MIERKQADYVVDKPTDEGFSVTLWGERARTRVSAAGTGGRLSILDYWAPSGFGPPRHVHKNDDELFLIESGRIVVWTANSCGTAGPGDVVLLPRGVPHTWRAYEGPVHLQVTVTPGEFEKFFERIVERNLDISDVAELTAVAAESGMEITGPPLSDDEMEAILANQAGDVSKRHN